MNEDNNMNRNSTSSICVSFFFFASWTIVRLWTKWCASNRYYNCCSCRRPACFLIYSTRFTWCLQRKLVLWPNVATFAMVIGDEARDPDDVESVRFLYLQSNVRLPKVGDVYSYGKLSRDTFTTIEAPAAIIAVTQYADRYTDTRKHTETHYGGRWLVAKP